MSIGLLSFGAVPATPSTRKATVNMNIGAGDLFMNLAKGVSLSSSTAGFAGILDADQYWQGNTTTYGTLSGNMPWPNDYFGHFVLKWTGTGSFNFQSLPFICYSISPSGSVNGIAGASGATSSGMTPTFTNASPRVEFALGALLTSVSTEAGSGLVKFGVTAGYLTNALTNGSNIPITSITGNGTTVTVNAPAHTLPIGLVFQININACSIAAYNATQTCTVTDADNFTFANATSGTAATPGNYVPRAGNCQFNHLTGPMSNATTFMTYRIDVQTVAVGGTAAYAGLVGITSTGGAGTQSEIIVAPVNSQVDLQGPVGTYSWSGLVICRLADETAIDSGLQIRQTAIDNVNVLHPKYIRFMDQTSVINSTVANFGGRARVTQLKYGAGRSEPTYWAGQMTRGASDAYTCSNPSGSGVGAYVDGETIQGYADNANLTATPTLNVGSRGAKPIFGLTCCPLSMKLTGSTTTGDIIGVTFTGSYITGSPFTLNYTVKSSDTTIDILGASLAAAMSASTTLQNANISFGNAGNGSLTCSYNRNAGGGTGGTASGVAIGGGTSFSYSVTGAGTEILTLGTLALSTTSTVTGQTNAIPASSNRTYSYSQLLDGWVQNLGLNAGTPFEVCAEICNRTGAGYWANIPLMYTTAAASAYGALLANTSILNAGLPIVVELSNEVWNFTQFQTTMAGNLGVQIGFSAVNLTDYHDFYALRFIQLIANSFTSGYTGAGGSRSTLELCIASTVLEGDGHYSGQMQNRRWNGQNLTTSGNATYAALGGPDCTSTTTNYNASPTRPIDLADTTSYALYFKGALIRGTVTASFTGGSGQQSYYNSIFQASADYASGNSTLMASAISAWNDDIVNGTRNGVAGADCLNTFLTTNIAGWQTKVASYDAQRAGYSAPAVSAPLNVHLYEAALEQGLSADSVNGLNTNNPTDLQARFVVEGYTLFPTYGASNNEVAANIINLFFAYRNSSVCAGMVQNTYCGGIVTAHPGRNAYPAWYGYTGPSVWAFYPGNLSTTPYGTYTGFAAF